MSVFKVGQGTGGGQEEEGIMSTQLAYFTQPAERRAADKGRLARAPG